jgi:hypothetical protein
MTERPPSQPADHPEDFSRRYAEDLEIVAGQAMMDLGIADDRMGARDHTCNSVARELLKQMERGWRGN